MRVLVTGASGFVGRHVVAALLARGHSVLAVARDESRLRAMPWSGAVDLLAVDIHAEALDCAPLVRGVDCVVHLAWPGLPNYRARFHYEHNLFADYTFLAGCVAAGLKHLLVTGTCLEYGLASGCCDESALTDPSLSYPLAKDTLHRFLRRLAVEQPFALQWVRLFYMYGEGQSPSSLLSQLDRAIDGGAQGFPMSGGEQLRDYLPVATAAAHVAKLVEFPEVQGAINCCSGRPTSVRRLVEEHLRLRGASMRLELGVYPYPDYEPMAFWGARRKLDELEALERSRVVVRPASS
jgi:nucleoside-diphosphate-sugar epimerase